MSPLALEIITALDQQKPLIGQPRLELCINRDLWTQLRKEGPPHEFFYDEELEAWTFHYAEVIVRFSESNWRIL